MYMFIVLLFLVVYLQQLFFKQAKTVRLQEPSAPFCRVLNELIVNFTFIEHSMLMIFYVIILL